MTYTSNKNKLIPPHGGYKKLESYKTAVIICDATFSGETDYTYENEDESIVEIDTTANTITGGELLSSKVFLADAEIDLFILNDRIQSGSTLTVAMRVIQTPTADLGAALVWREEF